jgi:phosphatidylglycerophosphatase C
MNKTTIAIFDFDETLTVKDSLIPFLCFLCGTWKTYLALFLLIPQFIKYLLNCATRQEMKEAILSKLIKGMDLSGVKEQGILFASKEIHKMLNPAMMARLRWHQAQGHLCYIASAGLELYIAPWGEQNQMVATLASKCAIDSSGKLTGQLQGLNCWGPEKVRRLQQLLHQREHYVIYAYGDSKGDHDLLTYADFPVYRYKDTT